MRDLCDAIAAFLSLRPEDGDYGLLRTMVRTKVEEIVRYLPDDLELADCGLLDGVTLILADRTARPAPELSVDRARRGDDLYLIDQRGTHRGRVTRLADGESVLVGRDPPDGATGRVVLVDDSVADPHALTLRNVRGVMVLPTILQREKVYLAGTPASRHEGMLLPGSTISFREGGNDLVTFVIATAAALHGRSPVGRVQYDVTAQRSVPGYPELSERGARIKQRPSKPEPRRFTWEFVAVSTAMAGVLYLTTHNALSLLTTLTAAVPVITYFRQKKQDRKRYAAEHAIWVKSLEETSQNLTDVVGKEEGNLKTENPAAEEWAVRAYRRLAGLWEHDPAEQGFLNVRLGLGELYSRYQSRIEGDIDLQDDPDFKEIIVLGGYRKSDRDMVRPMLSDAPIVVDLRDYHLGLVGPLSVVDAVATDVLLQVACAQPPGTVGIAALLPASPFARERYDWLKWLPHTRSGSTLLPSTRMLAGREPCAAFLLEMQKLHSERRAHRADEEPGSYAVLIVNEAAEVDLGLLSEVCDLADGLVRVIWLGSSKDTAPKLVDCVVEVTNGGDDAAPAMTEPARTVPSPGAETRSGSGARGLFVSGPDKYAKLAFDVDLFNVAPTRTVRALAGLYDPRSSGANAGVPQSVPLAAVIELEHISYRERPDVSLATRFPVSIGVGDVGALDLDLIEQGPHMLIGGTTGSGKSELLQTLTCGLVSRYSPNEASLFLIDFKGGATFAPFKDLPHVVGYITDLDQLNVNRALDFLRAELRRRERCFQEMGDAKEYGDYLERALAAGRDDILPRLVVIFDEFATIVQEFNKDTITAVVDIARRGRSWGVHLILATQQPTRDVVVPPVRGNVNARIALRTPSPDESQTIIDRPDAAHIPQSLPGRALMALGGNRLVEFQTAFSGAPFVPDEQHEPVLVSKFDITALATAADEELEEAEGEAAGAEEAKPADAEDARPQKQLEALVATVAGLGWGPSPGARSLPPALEECPVRPAPIADRSATAVLRLGLRDLPKRQTQEDLIVDLTRGGLCVVGPNRSGTTTTLVTAAEAFISQLPDEARAGIICIDAADRLREELRGRFENVIALSVTRLDQVTRVIDQLWEQVQLRMMHGEADGNQQDRPYILLLIDGCDRLLAGLAGNRGLQWAAHLADILANGRRVGIHACVTAKRLRDLDNSVLTSAAEIISLYGQYEKLETPQEDRLPGFGLDRDGGLVQVFAPRVLGPSESPGPDDSRDAEETQEIQLRRITLDPRLARAFDPDGWRRGDRTPAVNTGGPHPDRGIGVGLGIDELFRRTVPVWLAESSLTIVGGARSGRTRLLLTLADQVHDQTDASVAMVAPRGLPSGAPVDSVIILTGQRLSEIKSVPMGDQAAWLAGLGTAQLKDGRVLLLIDDLQALTAMERGDVAANLIADLYRRSLVQLIVTTTATDSIGDIGRQLKAGGTTVYLKPKADRSDYDVGSKARGMVLRHRPDMAYQPGDIIIQTDERQLTAHMPELREATPGQ